MDWNQVPFCIVCLCCEKFKWDITSEKEDVKFKKCRISVSFMLVFHLRTSVIQLYTSVKKDRC